MSHVRTQFRNWSILVACTLKHATKGDARGAVSADQKGLFPGYLQDSALAALSFEAFHTRSTARCANGLPFLALGVSFTLSIKQSCRSRASFEIMSSHDESSGATE